MSTQQVTGSTRSWFKSSHSGGTDYGNCVEVAADLAIVRVRDSNDTAGPNLGFSVAAWSAFVAFAATRSHP